MRARQQALLPPHRAGRFDLKRGRGGLTDVEFAVACLQVTRRSGHPATRVADPVEALDVLASCSDIPQDVATELAAGYLLLRRVEARARLRSARGADTLEFPSAASERVAASLGQGSAGELERLLAEHTQRIADRSDELLRRVGTVSEGSG
jgi:glutamate-ammonia-ligase adenylyltransferase